ncbi:MAG: hypothetical protein QOF70_6849, partial [Acetobacteraceae bacterium]|nr:hypothetical protein [Acetobacteraceae bacterium]
ALRLVFLRSRSIILIRECMDLFWRFGAVSKLRVCVQDGAEHVVQGGRIVAAAMNWSQMGWVPDDQGRSRKTS